MREFARLQHLRAALIIALAGSAGSALAEDVGDLRSQLERDLTVAQRPIYQITQPERTGRLPLDAWVDRADLTYVVGQPLRVMVRPHQDAYLTVVDVGSSGRVTVLYPNFLQQNSRVRAGSTVSIPSARTRWQIKVGRPIGIDLIQVIASRRPLTLPELTQLSRGSGSNPVVSLGRSAEDVARDLVLQLNRPDGANQQRIGLRNLLIRIVEPAGDAPASPLIVIPPTAVQPVPGAPTGVLVPSPNAPFGLMIRPDRAAYHIGEQVRIVVSSQKDCRLTLINVGASGKAVQLFPNSLQRDNLIRGGHEILIPSPQARFQVLARAPAGAESLLAICRSDGVASQLPIDPGQGDFVTIGNAQDIGRDLLVSGTSGAGSSSVEYATASFVVVE